ncbi:MAG: acetylglutamate kinase [Deltaproteobacteria bacterium]|nr:acetylglutamate kinase [Deltaproteobacteria bacterium]
MSTARRPTAVLKFGGEVVVDGAQLAEVLSGVAALVDDGWRFVLCHGGGPQVSAMTRRLGMEPVMVGGRRVTDDATLQVAKAVLGGEVNVDIVAAALAAGLDAIGICGVSGRLIAAHRRPPKVVSGGGAAPVDFGHVGVVDAIRVELLEHLWAGGYTPVVSTLGVGGAAGGTSPVYNINADTVAAALASALEADHLFLMTGVGAVLSAFPDPASRIARLSAAEAREAIAQGVISGGMIPKVEEALERLRGEGRPGIGAVHIVGSHADSLVEEAREPGSRGTVLVP